MALVGAIGDYFVKASSEPGVGIVSTTFFIGTGIYALTAFGWFFIMRHVDLGKLGGVYSIATILFLVIVGTAFFRERPSAYEFIGLALAVTSLLLLSRFG